MSWLLTAIATVSQMPFRILGLGRKIESQKMLQS